MPLAELTYSTYPHGKPLFAGKRRLVNLCAEKAEGQARQPFVLKDPGGMKEFSDLTSVADTAGLDCRGFHKFLDTEYVVVGSFLLSYASDGTPTFAASGIAGTGPVTMVSDYDQMLIITAPGTDDYLWDGTNLSQLTGANIVDWRDAAIIDGYAVCVQNTPAIAGRFSWTDTNALATVGASSFANAESSPDALLRIMKVGRILWLLGADTIEPWYSTGDSDAPFARYADSMHGIGIGAEDSRAVLPAAARGGEDKGFFLGVSGKSRPGIYMVQGGSMVKVSTNAIDAVLESGTYSDAIGFTYSQQGHDFYNLVLPTLGRSFTFDAALPLEPFPFWHERQSGVDIVGSWDARQCAVAHDKVLVGHKSDGKIYELDVDTYTDAGSDRMRLFSAMIPMSGEFGNTVAGITAEMRTGVGVSGASTEPQVIMRLSKDGGLGEEWGEERWRGLGKSGQRKRRPPTWWGCGLGREAIAEFRVTEPVEVAVTAVHAWGRPGRR